MKAYMWAQGSHPAAMAPHGVVVMSPGNMRLVHRCWKVLHEGGDLVVIMEKLVEHVGSDLTSLPEFVAVVVAGHGLHVAIRGNYELVVRSAGKTQSVVGGTATWWTERRFFDVESWRIRVIAPGEELDAGVWNAVDAFAPVAIVETTHDYMASMPESWDDLSKEDSSEDSAFELDGGWAAGCSSEQEESAQEEKERDRTLGETNYFAEIDDDAARGEYSSGPAPMNMAEDHVGDHDGHTLRSAKMSELQLKARELAAKTAAVGTSSAAPKVLAVLCVNGHPNPTHAQTCRECSGMMGETSVVIPQPKLGALVLSNGTREELYGDIIIGRDPKVNEAMAGKQRGVAVPSPKKEISRNHCEIRVTGWDVRLRDLGSNNGTLLVRPGQSPVLVSETAPVMMQPGDIIDLGDGLTIWLEG